MKMLCKISEDSLIKDLLGEVKMYRFVLSKDIEK